VPLVQKVAGSFVDRPSEIFYRVPTNYLQCRMANSLIVRRPSLNRKLEISTAPTKAKLREPAYSQAPIQNKTDRQRVRSRGSDKESQGGVYS